MSEGRLLMDSTLISFTMICVSPPIHHRRNLSRITIDGLGFAYDQVAIFQNFHLEVAANLILLEGPSGCGKTTLLKLLVGMICPAVSQRFVRPTPGRIILQEDAMFPWLTVEDNLACVPGWRGIS